MLVGLKANQRVPVRHVGQHDVSQFLSAGFLDSLPALVLAGHASFVAAPQAQQLLERLLAGDIYGPVILDAL